MSTTINITFYKMKEEENVPKTERSRINPIQSRRSVCKEEKSVLVSSVVCIGVFLQLSQKCKQ